MMTNSLTLAASLLGATFMLCFTLSRAWRGWLELKRLELAADRMSPEADEGGGADEDIGVRIELAAVRERLKKLEAIASGVEL